MEEVKQERKIFVGGITRAVDEDVLKEHFSKYGAVEECVIVLDKLTRRPREFGFVTFTDLLVAKRVLEENHSIFGNKIDVKPSEPRRERNQSNQEEQSYIAKKIFVGGLPHNLTEDELKDYFAKFGAIEDGLIICDKKFNTPKGFGFITFEADCSVVNVLHKQKNKPLKLNDKQVEVRRARPEVKRNRHGMWWLQSEDLAFGGCCYFCYSCGGAYGYGHYQGCPYWPNSYTGYFYSHPYQLDW